MAQQLEVFQSLWAMEQRIPGRPERPMEENFRMIAEAGFAGACIDPAVDEIPAMSKLKPLFEHYGLNCMVNAFPHRTDELRPLLELASEMNACQVNFIGTQMPLTVAEGVPLVRRWLDDARAVGMPLLFETHRDSLLNDLAYALQLIEAVPEMRLCADLSHYVVDRELRLPLNTRDSDYIRRILARSDCFQGRVASNEQVQIQIGFEQFQKWVEVFKSWWADGLRQWRQRNGTDAKLVFLCELGPPPYAITDARGLELSDRWQEALQIKRWVEAMWADPPPGAH